MYRSFDSELKRVLSEMPLVGYNVDKLKDGPSTKHFAKQSVNALQQPKVIETLTQKLSRHKYNIVIIADPGGDTVTDLMGQRLPDKYCEETGIDRRIVRRAITMILTYDNNELFDSKNGVDRYIQHHFSPWIILHQIGEIATAYDLAGGKGDIWDKAYMAFRQHLSKVPKARGREKFIKLYDHLESWYDGEKDDDDDENSSYFRDNFKIKSAFTHLFEMKSAREFIHGGAGNYDMAPELYTEYLWHGTIRMNYHDWIERDVVDKIKEFLINRIETTLDAMVGKAFDNNTFRDMAY
jgi:hypothetical protein